MKAQRRHELQTNSLAQFLENVPLYFRFHFGKVVFAALVLVLVVMLVRYRINTSREGKLQLATSSNDIRRLLVELQQLDLTGLDAVQRMAERRRLVGQIEAAADQVMQETSDPDDSPLRAEVLIARGDLYWTLANVPDPPEATTQPVLRSEQTPEELLASAEKAYQEVLDKYSQQQMAALTARFGLAAIAENRSQWDIAAALYQAILNREDVGPTFKELAMVRLQAIPTIRQPVYFGTLTTQPATVPSTMPTTQRDLRDEFDVQKDIGPGTTQP